MDTTNPRDWDALRTTLVRDIRARQERRRAPLVLGVCGSQGSGKTTLARRLEEDLSAKAPGHEPLRVASLSIDDLYLERQRRIELARHVHPLLETRGVPGTHDVELGVETLDALVAAGDESVVAIPRFDKATDDRCAKEHWTRHHGRIDVVLFEGWCVGVRPQPDAALREPINELERSEDPGGVWRSYVNRAISESYAELFGRLNALLFLRAPAFDVVARWRDQQESELRVRAQGASGVLDPAAVVRFVQYFERLTRWMLDDMPSRADVCVQLGEQRQIVHTRGRLFEVDPGSQAG